MNEAELRALLPEGLAHRQESLEGYRAAAVLVALEPGRGVWLTRRSPRMLHHAGQVSFPGGKLDPGDASAEAAALREAWEEIGLDPANVEILGRLDEHITGTGFHMTPVVALVPPGVEVRIASDEVVDVFCLPFETLLDPALPHTRHACAEGVGRDFYVWPHEQHVIWGATAAILRKLALRLRGEW
jgi:8-oxo-dGTP pyrophosphatase MutT (NUDIX family)